MGLLTDFVTIDEAKSCRTIIVSLTFWQFFKIVLKFAAILTNKNKPFDNLAKKLDRFLTLKPLYPFCNDRLEQCIW